jgi:hypothetical protein
MDCDLLALTTLESGVTSKKIIMDYDVPGSGSKAAKIDKYRLTHAIIIIMC